MTDEKLNGGIAGGELANSEKQTEGSSNGGEQNANITKEKYDELAKASAGKDSKIAELTKLLKEKEDSEKQKDLASKSAEEQLQIIMKEREAEKKEKALIDALSSKGLNVTETKKAVALYEAGDFDGYANVLFESQERLREEASKKSVEEFKNKFETSKAPVINDKKETTPARANKRWNRYK